MGEGAAHSNTQGKGRESIDSLLGYREDTEVKRTNVGQKDRRDKRRNLGLPSVAPSLL